MLLALEGNIGDRQSLLAQRLHHHLRLIRQHYLIFKSLKEDDRTRKPLCKVERRALAIKVCARRIRANQPVQITRLELVRLRRERREVADAEVARARFEEVSEG